MKNKAVSALDNRSHKKSAYWLLRTGLGGANFAQRIAEKYGITRRTGYLAALVWCLWGLREPATLASSPGRSISVVNQRLLLSVNLFFRIEEAGARLYAGKYPSGVLKLVDSLMIPRVTGYRGEIIHSGSFGPEIIKPGRGIYETQVKAGSLISKSISPLGNRLLMGFHPDIIKFILLSDNGGIDSQLNSGEPPRISHYTFHTLNLIRRGSHLGQVEKFRDSALAGTREFTSARGDMGIIRGIFPESGGIYLSTRQLTVNHLPVYRERGFSIKGDRRMGDQRLYRPMAESGRREIAQFIRSQYFTDQLGQFGQGRLMLVTRLPEEMNFTFYRRRGVEIQEHEIAAFNEKDVHHLPVDTAARGVQLKETELSSFSGTSRRMQNAEGYRATEFEPARMISGQEKSHDILKPASLGTGMDNVTEGNSLGSIRYGIMVTMDLLQRRNPLLSRLWAGNHVRVRSIGNQGIYRQMARTDRLETALLMKTRFINGGMSVIETPSLDFRGRTPGLEMAKRIENRRARGHIMDADADNILLNQRELIPVNESPLIQERATKPVEVRMRQNQAIYSNRIFRQLIDPAPMGALGRIRILYSSAPIRYAIRVTTDFARTRQSSAIKNRRLGFFQAPRGDQNSGRDIVIQFDFPGSKGASIKPGIIKYQPLLKERTGNHDGFGMLGNQRIYRQMAGTDRMETGFTIQDETFEARIICGEENPVITNILPPTVMANEKRILGFSEYRRGILKNSHYRFTEAGTGKSTPNRGVAVPVLDLPVTREWVSIPLGLHPRSTQRRASHRIDQNPAYHQIAGISPAETAPSFKNWVLGARKGIYLHTTAPNRKAPVKMRRVFEAGFGTGAGFRKGLAPRFKAEGNENKPVAFKNLGAFREMTPGREEVQLMSSRQSDIQIAGPDGENAGKFLSTVSNDSGLLPAAGFQRSSTPGFGLGINENELPLITEAPNRPITPIRANGGRHIFHPANIGIFFKRGKFMARMNSPVFHEMEPSRGGVQIKGVQRILFQATGPKREVMGGPARVEYGPVLKSGLDSSIKEREFRAEKYGDPKRLKTGELAPLFSPGRPATITDYLASHEITLSRVGNRIMGAQRIHIHTAGANREAYGLAGITESAPVVAAGMGGFTPEKTALLSPKPVGVNRVLAGDAPAFLGGMTALTLSNPPGTPSKARASWNLERVPEAGGRLAAPAETTELVVRKMIEASRDIQTRVPEQGYNGPPPVQSPTEKTAFSEHTAKPKSDRELRQIAAAVYDLVEQKIRVELDRRGVL